MSTETETPVSPPLGWRTVDWAAHSHRVEVGDDRVSYVDIGEGEPTILLIHGLGGNWTAWLETIPMLTPRHRVIAVDLPGFGGSSVPKHGISIGGYAAALTRLLAQLELDRVIVVGSSLGGWVAAELAQRAPDMVSALVLVDAAGIVPSAWERRKALSMMEGAALMAPLAPRFRRAVASRPGLRNMALRYTAARPSDLAADLVYMALPAAPDPGFRPALRACKRSWSQDWCDRLSDIQCPTLVVWGELDSLLPVRHAREYARRIPRSELCVIRDAGHLPMLERPADFNAELSRFIARSIQASDAGPAAAVATDSLG
jgi:pimeloyl-ACP methyl ester carboxylesterase